MHFVACQGQKVPIVGTTRSDSAQVGAKYRSEAIRKRKHSKLLSTKGGVPKGHRSVQGWSFTVSTTFVTLLEWSAKLSLLVALMARGTFWMDIAVRVPMLRPHGPARASSGWNSQLGQQPLREQDISCHEQNNPGPIRHMESREPTSFLCDYLAACACAASSLDFKPHLPSIHIPGHQLVKPD